MPQDCLPDNIGIIRRYSDVIIIIIAKSTSTATQNKYDVGSDFWIKTANIFSINNEKTTIFIKQGQIIAQCK